VLHRYPPEAEEVKRILPPWQNVRGPLAVIVGIDAGLMVTTVAAEAPAQAPVVVTV
jgi:hypothetical protein